MVKEKENKWCLIGFSMKVLQHWFIQTQWPLTVIVCIYSTQTTIFCSNFIFVIQNGFTKEAKKFLTLYTKCKIIFHNKIKDAFGEFGAMYQTHVCGSISSCIDHVLMMFLVSFKQEDSMERMHLLRNIADLQDTY